MVLSAALLAAGASPAVVDRAAASPRAGLPRHFGIGVSAEPDATGLYGWMPRTRIPFDYAYAYLAAGVNTGNGWQTWNTNAEYPLLYARGARKRGYVPVFPYYMLLQSTGSCDACPEAQRDLTNLNTPSLTAAYYRDFAMLLKRPIGPYLVQTDRALCASVVSRSERLLDDNVLMPEARRELQEMLGYVGWVHPGLRAVSSGPLTAAWHARPLMAPGRAISLGPMPCRGPEVTAGMLRGGRTRPQS